MSELDILGLYMKDLEKIPVLSAEEQNALAIEARKGDKLSKEKLIRSNLKFVINVAKKYRNRGIEFEDLISEGNIGLMNAIDKYEASRGYHFISYAVWWIRQSILKCIQEKSRTIRIPTNKLIEIRTITGSDGDLSCKSYEDIERISATYGLEPKYVRELISISQGVISLDVPLSNDKDSRTLAEYTPCDPSSMPEEQYMSKEMTEELDRVLETLTPVENRILRMRYGLDDIEPMSLKQIGDKLNLSKERIRQIEIKALGRMKMSARKNRLEAYVS